MIKDRSRNVEQLQQEKHQIEVLLEKQQKRMRSIFSADLEKQFWQDREDRQTNLLLRAFLPASIIYFIFEIISLPINYFTTELAYRTHDVLLTMVSYSTGWFALLFMYFMAKKPKRSENYSTIIATIICLSLALVQIVLFSTQSLAMTWRGSLLIVLAQIFAFLCTAIKPLKIFMATLVAAIICCIVLSFSKKVIPHWVLFNVMILGNLVGLALATLSVSIERIRFLQSIIINLDKQITETLNQHLFELSQQDTLTLLGNHRGFEQHLKQKMEDVKKTKQNLAVLFIDVDYFKLYNDNYGHLNGDLALIQVAQIISRHIAENDLAIRYGGEEFVILLEDTNEIDAKLIAAIIIQDMFDRKIPHDFSKISNYLSVSIGLTIYGGEQDFDADDILKAADFALYQAKRNGRNQSAFVAMNHQAIFNS